VTFSGRLLALLLSLVAATVVISGDVHARAQPDPAPAGPASDPTPAATGVPAVTKVTAIDRAGWIGASL